MNFPPSPILLADPRVAAVALSDSGEPLVTLPSHLTRGTMPVLVRAGLASRLELAATLLPAGYRLAVIEGHRSIADQLDIIAGYAAQVARSHPASTPAERERLVSRFVAPLEVAPHVAGAAVDLTLIGADGEELNMGTAVDATPEQSGGRCYFAAEVGLAARRHRNLLAAALGTAGLVNYPTEWWHWSYGDRYWALMTGATEAIYAPVELAVAA